MTGKEGKIDNIKLTAMQDHLCSNYSPFYEDFPISTREINDFKLKIMESLIIARDKSCLNKGIHLCLYSYLDKTSMIII